jgi:hypothetical protein
MSMTNAEEMRIHAVSPVSTLEVEEVGVSAKATPTINKLRKNRRNKNFFIKFLPDYVF